MFWIALATAIMMLSGEGDDTRAISAVIAGLRDAITHLGTGSVEKAEALRAVAQFEQAFATHRSELRVFGQCVDDADRNYRATHASYTACSDRVEAQRLALRRVLETVQRDYEAALGPE